VRLFFSRGIAAELGILAMWRGTFRMTASNGRGHMTNVALSPTHSPLPSLATRSFRRNSLAQLDAELLRVPQAVVSEHFWLAVRRLDEMLGPVLFVARKGAEASRRRRVLDEVMALMHGMSALVGYLDNVARATLPSAGKKNKPAKDVLTQMENTIDRTFKVPINLVKHAQHQLAWVEQSTLHVRTAGFIVFGAIESGVRGSAHGSRPIEEGYSFAFLLRSVLPAVFDVCRICEAALDAWGLLEPVERSSAEQGTSEDRVAQLRRVLDLCASLPSAGFPNELGRAVLDLELTGCQVSVKKGFDLEILEESRTTSLEVDALRQGDTVKLPYWMRQKSGS
jgi:hypothetical protein